jgi:hypothetical protein
MRNVAVTQVTVYILFSSKTKGLKLGFPVDLEFLGNCMSNISDSMTQKWSLDNAVD